MGGKGEILRNTDMQFPRWHINTIEKDPHLTVSMTKSCSKAVLAV